MNTCMHAHTYVFACRCHITYTHNKLRHHPDSVHSGETLGGVLLRDKSVWPHALFPSHTVCHSLRRY